MTQTTALSVERWITRGLAATLLLLGGYALGDTVAARAIARVAEAQKIHAELPGHAVELERVKAIQDDILEVKQMVQQLWDRGQR